MANYKKGVDLASPIRELEDVDISSKELTPSTGTRNKGPTEISKKRFELELGKQLDRTDIMEDNMK